MKRRNNFISRQLEETAGSSTAAKIKQTAVLLKSFDECERTKILEVANVGQAEINAEEMVALKADIGIPWEKMKIMARYICLTKKFLQAYNFKNCSNIFFSCHFNFANFGMNT